MFCTRFSSRIFLFLSLLIFPVFAFAYDGDNVRPGVNDGTTIEEAQKMSAGADEKKEKFNAGEMITEHISDAHDWHLWGHTHIPLPIILYTDKGLEIFSSGNFYNHETHALQPYPGKHYTYALRHNHVIVVDEFTGEENKEASHNIMDFSITKNVLTIFIVLGLMCWMMISVAKSYKRRAGQAPKGLQSFIEPLVIFVRDDIAKASIGKKHERYLPYLLTIFFFIWISNLFGLIPIFPGGANMTGNIAVTMSLAVFTFIIVTLSANGHYWRHVFAMPGVPIGVLFILTPIEILGVFLRPFVLMIRLFANITAGHIIALSFFSMIFIFAEMSTGVGWGIGIFSWLFVVFMTALELLVCFLQAYVFTLLSAIYIGSAIEEGHHDDHAHDAHGHHEEAKSAVA